MLIQHGKTGVFERLRRYAAAAFMIDIELALNSDPQARVTDECRGGMVSAPTRVAPYPE